MANETASETPTVALEKKKSRRGFAAMDKTKQRAIASAGGRAAHDSGRAHEFTADEARAAGQRGGTAVSRDRAHMAALGRKGGLARSSRQRSVRQADGERARPREEREEDEGSPRSP
jgi:uncharacterized protein